MARKTSRSELLAAVCLYATPIIQERQALPVGLSDAANQQDRREKRQALSGATFFRVDDDGPRSEMSSRSDDRQCRYFFSRSRKTYSDCPELGCVMSGAITIGTFRGLPPPRPVVPAMY
jgi:hypothetical protein